MNRAGQLRCPYPSDPQNWLGDHGVVIRDINQTLCFAVCFPECPSPSLSSKTSVITKGQNVSLLCSIKKNPSTVMKYTLFRDKKQMGTTDGKKEFAIFNLTISEARDLGPYKCKVSCLKYSRDFNFTFANPVSTPVLTISVIQTQTGHNVTLRCISHNGSLPINYTFFENNGKVSPVISKNVREPAEFHFTKISTREGGKYKCEARNSLPNNTKDSQVLPMPSTGKIYMSQVPLNRV
ncbi:allergin-1 [Rhynchocyon petersi]